MRPTGDGRCKVVQRYIVSPRVSLTCFLYSVHLLWKETSILAHDTCPMGAMHSQKNVEWLKALLPQVDGWQTNELVRLAQTPNHSLPGKKMGLLEQPWLSVWVSDTLAKFGLAINGDSSRDLTFAGSLHSWA